MPRGVKDSSLRLYMCHHLEGLGVEERESVWLTIAIECQLQTQVKCRSAQAVVVVGCCVEVVKRNVEASKSLF